MGYWMTAESPNDKRTRVLNKLIYSLFKDEILSDNTTLRGLYLVKSYFDCYTVVFEMVGHYRNEDILLNILVSTVDKILEWCDITDRYNLDVHYITRGRRPININYYELMFNSYVNNPSRGYSRDGVDNFHPRFEKMCRWMHYNKPREYQAAMNRTYDPYRYRGNVQAQELAQQQARFGEYNVVMGGEQFYQQVRDQQRELVRGQMSLRWSDYETYTPCAEIELPNVVVTQRATKSKISEFFKKLKL